MNSFTQGCIVMLNEQIYKKNLEAIKQVNSKLYHELKNRKFDQQKFHLERAHNGSWTLKVKNKNDQYRYLHSKYNPEGEATRWIKDCDLSGKKYIFIFGLGLGYHLHKVLKKKPKEATVFVFEPEIDLLFIALHLYDYSYYIKNGKIVFTAEEKINSIHYIMSVVNFFSYDKITFLKVPYCELYNQSKYRRIISIINDYFIVQQAMINTNIAFQSDWLNNFKLNLNYLLKHPGIDSIKNCFFNLPAIIVSAGPSLDKNIHLLKRAKGRAVIIAVDTALRAAQKEGVTPDIVISVDAKEANWKHYEGLNYDNVILISDMASHYKIFHNHSGPKFIFYTSAYRLAENILEDTNSRRLASGGSVSTSAMELALHMGCNPIILIGQDLALGEDGLTHSSGTLFKNRKIKDKNRLRKVKDIYGNEILTLDHLYIFLKWFEQRIEALPDSIKVIDATEGGAVISGSVVMSFTDALDKYCIKNISAYKKLVEIHDKFQPFEKIKVINNLQTKIDDLKELNSLAEKGITKANELEQVDINEKEKVSVLLEEMNNIDNDIKAIETGNNLSELVAFPEIMLTMYNRHVNQELISEDPDVQLRAAAKKSENLYQALHKSYQFMIEYLCGLIDQLKSTDLRRN